MCGWCVVCVYNKHITQDQYGRLRYPHGLEVFLGQVQEFFHLHRWQLLKQRQELEQANTIQESGYLHQWVFITLFHCFQCAIVVLRKEYRALDTTIARRVAVQPYMVLGAISKIRQLKNGT